MSDSPKRRVAIVTGGAAGIGEGIVRRLLVDGYQCAIIDPSDPSSELEKAGVLGVHADVSDAPSVEAAFAEIAQHFGAPTTILVCNAGIVGPTAPVEEYDPGEWHRVIAVDLIGVFLCCRAAVPGMRTEGFGRIVNIASIAGKEGNPRMSAYSAAKAGVIGFTKSLAKELATDGITVNALTPAVVRTEMVEAMAPEVVDYMVSRIPMGRTAEIDEVAAAVSFLVNEATFSTGSVLDVSGGRATY
jgi:NAD(P)-dependent dehydrogenase (short-subunit alcohol dehydrogenase family)